MRGVRDIADATLEELGELGQDILSHLRTVADMTFSQIAHLSQRLVDFAEHNLQNFIELMDGVLFSEMLQDFGCERRWAPSQARLFITRAVETVGDITGWDIDRFREIGSLIRGEPSDAAALAPNERERECVCVCVCACVCVCVCLWEAEDETLFVLKSPSLTISFFPCSLPHSTPGIPPSIPFASCMRFSINSRFKRYSSK